MYGFPGYREADKAYAKAITAAKGDFDVIRSLNSRGGLAGNANAGEVVDVTKPNSLLAAVYGDPETVDRLRKLGVSEETLRKGYRARLDSQLRKSRDLTTSGAETIRSGEVKPVADPRSVMQNEGENMVLRKVLGEDAANVKGVVQGEKQISNFGDYVFGGSQTANKQSDILTQMGKLAAPMRNKTFAVLDIVKSLSAAPKAEQAAMARALMLEGADGVRALEQAARYLEKVQQDAATAQLLRTVLKGGVKSSDKQKTR